MQCAVIEFARNILNISDANSEEFNPKLSPEQHVVIQMLEHSGETNQQGYGGTMRLGKRRSIFLTSDSVLS